MPANLAMFDGANQASICRCSPPPTRPLRRLVIAATVVALLCVTGGEQSAAAQDSPALDGPDSFGPPMSGPVEVVDGFWPPATRFGAGNRAIDIAVGGEVTITAPHQGVVAVAGPVFDSLVVSIDHPSGLRSVVSRLTVVEVKVGDRVEAGEPIGRADDEFSLSLRVGQTYLDPTILWPGDRATLPVVRTGQARLVPIAESEAS